MFSPPAGTKMFQFPACASPLSGDAGHSVRRVAPFGNPGINGHLRLPRAYRRLSRPSSPPGAKASTARPCSVLRRRTGGFPPPGADRDGAQKRRPSRFSSGAPASRRDAPLLVRVQHVKDLPSFPGPEAGGDKSRAPGCRSPRAPTGRPAYMKEARKAKRRRGGSPAPERRCSSRTFRYGYLVTT